jgi:hypothetical protein
MIGIGGTRLARELERVATLCTETLAELGERYPAVERTPFANELRLAVAAMETAVHQLDASPAVRQSSLLITITLAREAAEAARRHGIDEPMLRVASACEAVATLCETALAAG